MKMLGLSVAALMLLAGAAVASAQNAQSGEPNAPMIVTTGEAVVRKAPDRAFVQVSVETRAKNPKDAQAQNAQVMTAVQQKLRAANLAKDAIRTLGYSISPEYDYQNGRQTLKGYLARNGIEVRIDDINRVGEILDIATNSGATSVGDIRLDLKDRTAAERQALSEAVADGKAKAETIAMAAGHSIQTIWRIVEQGAPEPGPRPMVMMAKSARAEAEPTPIVAGEIEIRAQVSFMAIIK